MFQWEKISHTVMFNIKFTMIDFDLKAPIFIENLLVMIEGQATQLLRHTNIP